MKKIALSLIALLLWTLAVPALAAAPAVPNQELAFRTGPNTAYVWMGHMPQSTRLTAYEYEMGNDVVWVLVQYESGGQLYRGYTGLKRMAVNGSIPWADHLDIELNVVQAGSIYAAPSPRGAWRGSVWAGETVTVLDYEGDYAFIEYYDYDTDAPSRGYVTTETLGARYPDASLPGVPAEPNQRLSLRTGPTTSYSELYTLPESTRITAYEYEQGSGVTWVLVEFMHDGMRVRGYTGLKRMTVLGDIPWADHYYALAYLSYGCQVYAAPADDAAPRSRLNGGASVTLLEYDGDYAFIEYTNRDTGLPERGYIDADIIESACDWEWDDEYGE